MNIKRLVRALEKAGFKVNKKDCHEHRKGTLAYDGPFWHYTCFSETHKCDFYPNGRHDLDDASLSCCSVQVMRQSERNDSQSDYFPGCFCRTIKSVVSSMKGGV